MSIRLIPVHIDNALKAVDELTKSGWYDEEYNAYLVAAILKMPKGEDGKTVKMCTVPTSMLAGLSEGSVTLPLAISKALNLDAAAGSYVVEKSGNHNLVSITPKAEQGAEGALDAADAIASSVIVVSEPDDAVIDPATPQVELTGLKDESSLSVEPSLSVESSLSVEPNLSVERDLSPAEPAATTVDAGKPASFLSSSEQMSAFEKFQAKPMEQRYGPAFRGGVFNPKAGLRSTSPNSGSDSIGSVKAWQNWDPKAADKAVVEHQRKVAASRPTVALQPLRDIYKHVNLNSDGTRAPKIDRCEITNYDSETNTPEAVTTGTTPSPPSPPPAYVSVPVLTTPSPPATVKLPVTPPTAATAQPDSTKRRYPGLSVELRASGSKGEKTLVFNSRIRERIGTVVGTGRPITDVKWCSTRHYVGAIVMSYDVQEAGVGGRLGPNVQIAKNDRLKITESLGNGFYRVQNIGVRGMVSKAEGVARISHVNMRKDQVMLDLGANKEILTESGSENDSAGKLAKLGHVAPA